MSWSGIILVIAGALLLANNLNLLQWGWLYQWWPVFLIALGVWSMLRPALGSRRPAAEIIATRESDRRS